MLRLQNHFLFTLRATSHLPALPLHPFLLSTATAAATVQFVPEDYLVATSGLTPAQSLKASKNLRHLKSPANPDAVLAFFAGVGLARSDVAKAICLDSRFLCSGVEQTLIPRVAQLREMGLSPSQISRLIAIVQGILLAPSHVSRIEFYMSFLGSFDKFEAALKRNWYLLNQSIEEVVKPNMAVLQQCGLTARDIAKIFVCIGRLLTVDQGGINDVVARAEKLGARRGSGMFKKALVTVCNLSPEKISAKLDFLKSALGRFEAELAVRRLPHVLDTSEGKLGRSIEFLRMEVGLEPLYIARRPALLSYSLERRLMPRYYVIKVLKAKQLEKDIDFYGACTVTEKRFAEKYIDCHNECVPGLADAYAAACSGQIPEIQL